MRLRGRGRVSISVSVSVRVRVRVRVRGRVRVRVRVRRLPRAGLAVGEDRAVEALEDGVDDPCGGLLVEDLVRAAVSVRVRVRNRVE